MKKVNLKQVPADGTPMPVQASLDLGDLRLWGDTPIRDPVSLEGSLRTNNGIVELDYIARYTLRGVCARCLAPAQRTGSLEQRHNLAEQVADEKNDAFILVPDALLDLASLVREDLCLSIEGVLLCSEACRGLCPKCGADRNQTDCGCSPGEPDPRLGPLRALLEERDDPVKQ